MAYPQTTPMRPVPGAFLNTPAAAQRFPSSKDPARRRLWPTGENAANAPLATDPATTTTAVVSSSGGTSSGSTPAQPGSAAFTSTNLTALPSATSDPPIVRAAKAINTFLQQDETFPSLESYCKNTSSDYEISGPDSRWAPFHRTNMYPIPNQVFEQFNVGQMQTLMGLFAEINHAWVAIDNCLYLWDYTSAAPELVGFEDQPQTIQAVALVPPKPNIFVKSIAYILAVATTSEMILLGVSTADTAAGTKSVSLYQTRMSLPLRGTDVRVIRGTEKGRIFFGGSNDIDLYELYYQSEEKWFSNRCGKINHTNRAWSQVVNMQSGFWSSKTPEYLMDIAIDDSRKLVYTLSSTSTIRVYHMDDSDRLKEVVEKTMKSCLMDYAHSIGQQSKLLSDRMRFVSISPISKQEADRLHLMALTDTGCRLFLTAASDSLWLITSRSSVAPQSLSVQYVKFPPSTHQRQTSQALGESFLDADSDALSYSRHGVRFAPGYFLDFVNKGKGAANDSLFLSGPEAPRIKNASPTVAPRHHEHATWIDIGSRAEAVGLISTPFAAARQPIGFGNELAVQFDEKPSEFAILTNTGVHVIRRRRFVDIFASAIRGAAGDEGYNQLCRRMIQLYGRIETVSTALAVACGHGGDATSDAARTTDQVTEDRARTCYIDFGGQPTIAETDGTALTTDSVKLSSRHDALALYLSRLTRQLWKQNIVKTGVSPVGAPTVESTVPLVKLQSVQENIERLRRFLEANRGLIQGLSGPSDLDRASTRQEEVALQAEHQALHALQKLMESMSEGISFVLMLFDERVADIYSRLDHSAQEKLRNLNYEKLFAHSGGRDLAKLLVKAIVNRNIESGSNVETVADALRRRCGSFCSTDDVVIFKAQEQLKRASEQPPNTNQSRALLSESLRLFEKVADSLTFDNLVSAAHQYAELKYFAGAIQLCLVVARAKDPGSTASSWVSDGKPAGDAREKAFNDRKHCYDLIHQVLQNLDEASSREPEMVDGRLSLMATKRREAYDVVNNSEDEVFHFDLYEWYIEQGWTDRILAIDSKHVVTFLQRLSESDAAHADLLCRFYTNRHQFFEAAGVQFDLANSDFDLGIKDRITLLSLAKANASVTTAGVSRQQQQMLSHSVSDLLDIAHIQDDLLERLVTDERITEEQRHVEIRQALDGKILDLSQLFNEYADQAGYYDLCLLIYHTADYRNATTIAGTWSNLIQQTHDESEAKTEHFSEGDALPALPYEAVTSKIQSLAHRTSLDSFVFPIQMLLPELCRYSLALQQDNTIGADPAWPVRLFLGLGVSHDMVVRILENLFDTQDHGFRGSARYRVVELIAVTVSEWVAEVRRRGGIGKGGSIGPGISELLGRCIDALPAQGQGSNPGGANLSDIRLSLRQTQREVDGLVDRVPTGSLRFM